MNNVETMNRNIAFHALALSNKKYVGYPPPPWKRKIVTRDLNLQDKLNSKKIHVQVEFFRTVQFIWHCWTLDYRFKRTLHVPLFTKHHRQILLRWDREHHEWTMESRERHASSDATRFILQHVGGILYHYIYNN